MLEPKQNLLKRLNIIGIVFSICGTIIYLTLVSVAHYYAYKAGYIIRNFELSELVLDSNIAKILFNTAIISYGILLLLPLLLATNYFREKKKHRFYLPLAIMNCLSLIGIGIFSEDVFPTTHIVIAFSFYIFGGILNTYTSIIFLKYDKTIPVFYSIIGFCSVFMLIFNVTTRWFFGQAYTQRIAVGLFILYFMLISLKILVRNIRTISEENKN